MAKLQEVVAFCDARTERAAFADFPGAENGLQLENQGEVSSIGAAVDAGMVPFQECARRGIDFVIVHHGMFWRPFGPIVGPRYATLRVALGANLAVYSSHLPLDAHPEIGNNVLLAREMGLAVEGRFLPHEGREIAVIATCPWTIAELRERLEARFPQTRSLLFGSKLPGRVAILSGSGRHAVECLAAAGTDTLITGELRQEHFNQAQEAGLNLFVCGHYDTEVFGVRALAAEVAERFGLPWEFIGTGCPL